MNFRVFIRCWAHWIGSRAIRCSSNFLGSLNSISQDQMWFSGSSCENNSHGFSWNITCGRATRNVDMRKGSLNKRKEPKSGRGHSQPPGSVQRSPSSLGNNYNKGVDIYSSQQVREGAGPKNWPHKYQLKMFRCLSLKTNKKTVMGNGAVEWKVVFFCIQSNTWYIVSSQKMFVGWMVYGWMDGRMGGRKGE